VWLVNDEKANSEGVDKEPLARFVQKNQTGWNLQYTSDESFCARVVTNEVQIYESHDLKTVWNKIRVEGVAEFAVSPGQSHNIAVFVPERKVNSPERKVCQPLTLFRVNLLLSESTKSQISRLLRPRRTFSRATRSK
jgi:uncharacterized protein with WD repeat